MTTNNGAGFPVAKTNGGWCELHNLLLTVQQTINYREIGLREIL